MNGSIRVSAKTVDDAITEALIQLGVTSDRLEYEVIKKKTGTERGEGRRACSRRTCESRAKEG